MASRPIAPRTHAYSTSLFSAFLYGLGGGLVGAAVMTLSAKVEQNLLTGRPNSLVPGHTLLRLLGLPSRPDSDMMSANLIAHFGFGAISGGFRGMMAWYGVRGPFADFVFMGVRLAFDQSLENLTGVGAAPWTWPLDEQIIDLVHKAIFSFVTGFIVDKWVI